MASETVAVLRIGECGESFLRDIHPFKTDHLHVYQRYRNSNASPEHPSPRLRRWAIEDDKSPLSAPGVTGLLSALTDSKPDVVFVVVPAIELRSLPLALKRDSYDVADALRRAKDTESWSVILLVDGTVQRDKLHEFDALYGAHSAFQDVAARQVLTERVRRLCNDSRASTASPLWTGALVFDGVSAERNESSFPGFELYSENMDRECRRGRHEDSYVERRLSELRGKSSKCVIAEGGFSNYGPFLLASRSLELRLGPQCTSTTGLFCNNWMNNKVSLFVQIEDIRLWCFWTSSTIGQHTSWRCNALIVPEIHVAVAGALDMVAFMRENLPHQCSIGPVPQSVAALPFFDTDMLMGQSSSHAGEEITPSRKQDGLQIEASSRSINESNAGSQQANLRREKAFRERCHSWLECVHADLSLPDREVLKAQSKKIRSSDARRPTVVVEAMDSKQVDEDQSARNTTRKEVSSIAEEPDASFLTVHKASQKENTVRLSNCALRQSRFGRLQYQKGTQAKRHRKEGDQERHGASERPVKRLRPMYEAQRKSEAMRMRRAFIAQERGRALTALERAEAFFNCSEAGKGGRNSQDCPQGKSSKCIGSANIFRDVEVHTFEDRVLSGTEYPRQCIHGIEYAQTGDGRDKLIRKLELWFSKDGTEFKSAHDEGNAAPAVKIGAAVRQLKQMGKAQRHDGRAHNHESDGAKAYRNTENNHPHPQVESVNTPKDAQDAPTLLEKLVHLFAGGQVANSATISRLAPISESNCVDIVKTMAKEFPSLKDKIHGIFSMG